jgi:hypothetical protein
MTLPPVSIICFLRQYVSSLLFKLYLSRISVSVGYDHHSSEDLIVFPYVSIRRVVPGLHFESAYRMGPLFVSIDLSLICRSYETLVLLVSSLGFEFPPNCRLIVRAGSSGGMGITASGSTARSLVYGVDLQGGPLRLTWLTSHWRSAALVNASSHAQRACKGLRAT